MTGAYVWRGASTIDAVEIANRLAEIDWHYHVRRINPNAPHYVCIYLLIPFETTAFIGRRAFPIGSTRCSAVRLARSTRFIINKSCIAYA